MKRLKNPTFKGSEWSVDKIDKGWTAINKLAKDKYGWEGYPVQFEVLSSQQMVELQVQHFMPSFYTHWSFGRRFLNAKADYESGRNRGSILEVIINTNPCICYCHEDNNMLEQLVIMSHAAVGHNYFFKNNYLFKEWTHPEFIGDYLIYAKNFIKKCEEDYGVEKVSMLLDIAHFLKEFGIFNFKELHKSDKTKKRIKEERISEVYSSYNPVIDRSFYSYKKKKKLFKDGTEETDLESSENLLFILENSTKDQSHLVSWHKEIFRIVRTIEQYFYPQIQTKVMNEGFASFCDYILTNELYDLGHIDDGYMIEYCKLHSNVCYQRDFNKDGNNQINPYYLGFNMFMEIKRICENPTEEDLEFCPSYCNTDWLTTINYVVANYRDESFIREFLTPNLIRKFKLFSISTRDTDKFYTVSAIHQKEDYKTIRNLFANNYSWESYSPGIDCKINSKTNELTIIFTERLGNSFRDDELELFRFFISKCWKKDVVIVVKDGCNHIVQTAFEGKVQ